MSHFHWDNRDLMLFQSVKPVFCSYWKLSKQNKGKLKSLNIEIAVLETASFAPMGRTRSNGLKRIIGLMLGRV